MLFWVLCQILNACEKGCSSNEMILIIIALSVLDNNVVSPYSQTEQVTFVLQRDNMLFKYSDEILILFDGETVNEFVCVCIVDWIIVSCFKQNNWQVIYK